VAYLADKIWKDFFKTEYVLHRKNCQNFAWLFFKRILVDGDDRRISTAERRTWQSIPSRLTQVKAMATKTTYLVVALGALVIYQVYLGSADEWDTVGELTCELIASKVPERDRNWLEQVRDTALGEAVENASWANRLLGLEEPPTQYDYVQSDYYTPPSPAQYANYIPPSPAQYALPSTSIPLSHYIPPAYYASPHHYELTNHYIRPTYLSASQ
jgi:hypothetical protein